ncbi:MAG: hypothetical protein MSC31_15880 [Solirubrobacteraceae bacterium MAG38_C4-C5]|nr:hypothetical protein [Candidatus Siliceabacter maunaloa]
MAALIPAEDARLREVVLRDQAELTNTNDAEAGQIEFLGRAVACEGGRPAGGCTVAVNHIALRIVGYTGFPKNKVAAASIVTDGDLYRVDILTPVLGTKERWIAFDDEDVATAFVRVIT